MKYIRYNDSATSATDYNHYYDQTELNLDIDIESNKTML